jgi:hypothetical protein
MFCGQKEINWRDLPQNEVTMVPVVIPVGEHGRQFKLLDHSNVPRPRLEGNLTRAAFQVFTMEKTPIDSPTPIDIPDEITLAQLVSHFILPAGGDWDVNTVFYWCPEEIEEEPKKGEKAYKTRRTIVEIPYDIPTEFALRVKANTLRDGPSNKRMARCVFGSVPMCFAMNEDAPLSRLKARVIDSMTQRGQGGE